MTEEELRALFLDKGIRVTVQQSASAMHPDPKYTPEYEARAADHEPPTAGHGTTARDALDDLRRQLGLQAEA